MSGISGSGNVDRHALLYGSEYVFGDEEEKPTDDMLKDIAIAASKTSNAGEAGRLANTIHDPNVRVAAFNECMLVFIKLEKTDKSAAADCMRAFVQNFGLLEAERLMGKAPSGEASRK